MSKINLSSFAFVQRFKPVLKLSLVAFLLSPGASMAATYPQSTYTWDPSSTGTGSDGSGSWDASTAIWANGGVDTLVPSVDSALAAPATTISSAIAVGNTSFTVTDATGLAVGQYISLTQFAPTTYITSIVGNTVTVSSAATGTLASGAIGFTTGANAVVFGAGTGSAGTVTVNAAQKAGFVTINAASTGNYTFSGTGSITVGGGTGTANGLGTVFVNSSATISSQFNFKNITFGVAGQTLTLSGGSTSGSTVGAFNGTSTGSSNAIAASSTIALTAGTFTTQGAGNIIDVGDQAAQTGGFQMSGGTFNVGGSFQIGGTKSAFANLTGGTVVASGQVAVGRNATTNIGKMVINGTAFSSTGVSNTDTQFQIGRGNGVGTVNMQSGSLSVIGNGLAGNNGGVLVINSNNTGTVGTGTLNISGGTVTTKDLRLNGGNKLAGGTNSTSTSSGGSATLNMTGGSLYIGGTIQDGSNGTTAGGWSNYGTGTSTYSIALSGGTVGANANWSSNLNMTLGTTNGNVTFKAASASDAAFNINLSGVLSGSGGLIKSGLGTLTLTGANTYAGSTSVTAGTLSINSAFLADGSDVSLTTGTIFDLNFTGSPDTINALYIDGVAQAVGTWGAVGSGAAHTSSFFTGTGVLNVTAVPEPSTVVLFGMGFGLILFTIRRRRWDS
jgi:hypothetical protein